MLTPIHTLKPHAADSDATPKILEFVERICPIPFQRRKSGIYVLMEHIDNPTDDHIRRWKFAQGQLDEHNKRPGFNSEMFLKNYFGFTEAEASMHEVEVAPIEDTLRSESAVQRKRFKRTITTWSAYEIAPGVEPMTEKIINWVPLADVLNVCELTRLETYRKVITMVPTGEKTTPKH